MSVILYDGEKFQRIYQSLHLKGQELGYLFGYPEGWDKYGGLDEHIRPLIQDWQRGNIMTWNRQYPDDVEPLELADLDYGVMPYLNDFELLKSLQGLRYNLISNDGEETDFKGSMGKLNRLIEHVMNKIIRRLPEYERADTW